MLVITRGRFTGHMLRSGFVTSAVEANAPLMKIPEQTRHESVQMLRSIRRIDGTEPAWGLDTYARLRGRYPSNQESLSP